MHCHGEVVDIQAVVFDHLFAVELQRGGEGKEGEGKEGEDGVVGEKRKGRREKKMAKKDRIKFIFNPTAQ